MTVGGMGFIPKRLLMMMMTRIYRIHIIYITCIYAVYTTALQFAVIFAQLVNINVCSKECPIRMLL